MGELNAAIIKPVEKHEVKIHTVGELNAAIVKFGRAECYFLLLSLNLLSMRLKFGELNGELNVTFCCYHQTY